MIDCLTIWSSKTKAFRNPFKKTFKTAVFVSAPDSEILDQVWKNMDLYHFVLSMQWERSALTYLMLQWLGFESDLQLLYRLNQLIWLQQLTLLMAWKIRHLLNAFFDQRFLKGRKIIIKNAMQSLIASSLFFFKLYFFIKSTLHNTITLANSLAKKTFQKTFQKAFQIVRKTF